MSSTNDKLYVYFNNQKIVDQTVKQFFEQEHGGRSFSEFAKSILYHFAAEHGFNSNISLAVAPPPPPKLTKKAKKAKQAVANKREIEKESGKSAREMTEEEADSPISSNDDDNMDDILSAVNSIL